MSNDLATLVPIPAHKKAKPMTVTATMQGEYGKGIQLTVGGEFIIIAENQVQFLISILQKRLKGEKGFKATEWSSPFAEIPVSPRIIPRK